MPNQVLGLGWDEWGSIAAVMSAAGYLLRGLLKRYVELPMQGIRNDLNHGFFVDPVGGEKVEKKR